jgi:hypothetical protein
VLICVTLVWHVSTRPDNTPQGTPFPGPSSLNVRRRLVACKIASHRFSNKRYPGCGCDLADSLLVAQPVVFLSHYWHSLSLFAIPICWAVGIGRRVLEGILFCSMALSLSEMYYLTGDMLSRECRERGLDQSGPVRSLRQRLANHIRRDPMDNPAKLEVTKASGLNDVVSIQEITNSL